MAEQSPTVRQRRLSSELRRLRERAGLTPENAAAAIGISRPQLVKIETAKTRPPLTVVERILGLYGGDDALKLALLDLARNIHQRGWWHAYGDVLSASYPELEDDAEEIRSWQVEVVPGLLQTADYARTLIRGFTADDAEVDRRLQARMTRKTLLDRENAPHLDVVLDEAMLHRMLGGVEVMRGQLRALIAATERPNVSVRVMPASVGLHAGIGEGSFVVFKFPRPIDLDVVYLESAAGGIYVEEVEKVRRCNVTYDRISDQALSVSESVDLIGAIIKE